jgi:hypothetical protein
MMVEVRLSGDGNAASITTGVGGIGEGIGAITRSGKGNTALPNMTSP